jgi:CrcB protein
MPNLLLVMMGGAVGAGFRYHIGRIALQNMGPVFPWSTLIVNLLGGLLMGVLAGILAKNGSDEPLRLFLGVGVLGGFTTFSAFSLETFNMIERGDAILAAAYVGASVAGSILLLLAGVWLTRIST